MPNRGVDVVRAGTLVTVQDLGRAGYAHLGVPGSGAADVPAHSHANELVGNAAHAATLEITAGGCEIRARHTTVVALTGAHAPLWVGSVPAPFAAPVRLAAGQTLEVGTPTSGLRTYFAVRGGIAVDPVLGSRATDVLSGLGPKPVRDSTILPVGSAPSVTQADFDRLRRRVIPSAYRDTNDDSARASALINVRVQLGPRDDWFTTAALGALQGTEYEVTADSNRVGVRLAGAALERAVTGELESEGVVTGAVQVPASGQPVIFLADHPTTGGYPVVAVVEPQDLPLVAQARPGDRVAFVASARPAV